jgi:hypothetical protein
MDASAFMLATLDCSTKNFTKASAPASVWALAASGICTAVVVAVAEAALGAEVVEGGVELGVPLAEAEAEAVAPVGAGSSPPPAHPATTPASTPTTAHLTARGNPAAYLWLALTHELLPAVQTVVTARESRQTPASELWPSTALDARRAAQ